jgi:hypothetical protein
MAVYILAHMLTTVKLSVIMMSFILNVVNLSVFKRSVEAPQKLHLAQKRVLAKIVEIPIFDNLLLAEQRRGGNFARLFSC